MGAHAKRGEAMPITSLPSPPFDLIRCDDPRLRSHYFRGSLIAIARHTATRPASLALLLRKLMVGSTLVATRRMSSHDFRAALRVAFSAKTGWAFASAQRRSNGGAA